MDPQFMSNFRMAIYGILTPIAITLGVLGNCITLLVVMTVVFTQNKPNVQHSKMNRTMYFYIAALSISDLGYLVFTAQNCYYSVVEGADSEAKEYIYRAMVPAWNTFKCISDYIVICMTYNRFSIVSKISNFSGKEQFKNAAANLSVLIQIVASVIGSVLIHLPLCLNVTKTCSSDDQSTNVTTALAKTCNQTDYSYHADTNLWVLYTSVYATVVKVFPILFVGIFNLLIARHLKTISQRRTCLKKRIELKNLGEVSNATSEQSNRSEKVWQFLTFRSLHEQTMARLTVCIAVVFIICNVPANVAYLQFSFDANAQKMPDWYFIEVMVTNLMECINYSFNFYLYCSTNGEIRRSVFFALRKVYSKLFRSD